MFAFIKLIKSLPDGKDTVIVNVSQIHNFNKTPLSHLQAYKIDVSPGVVEYGTVAFTSESKEEILRISKDMRIRQPNKTYIAPPLDTTDSENEKKKGGERQKRKYKEQTSGALDIRLNVLKKMQQNKSVAPFVKNPKISKMEDENKISSKTKNTNNNVPAESHKVKTKKQPLSTANPNIMENSLPAKLLDVTSSFSREQNTSGANTPGESSVSFPKNSVSHETNSMINTQNQCNMLFESVNADSIVPISVLNNLAEMEKTLSAELSDPSSSSQQQPHVRNAKKPEESSNSISKKAISTKFQETNAFSKTKNRCNTSAMVHKETAFKKAMTSRIESDAARIVDNNENKISKLTDSLKRTKQLLDEQRKKTEEKIKVIDALKQELQETQTISIKTEEELQKVRKMNEKWQNISMNKCDAIHAMFLNLKDLKVPKFDVEYPLVGYVSEDKSCVHIGRGEYISYDTYVLAMNGITFKKRRCFPRNLCVGVFGYDLLSKSTVNGEGSNRNGNIRKPERKLDPNKVLAIKDIYRHFCENELKMDPDRANDEACRVNEIIGQKIASIKQLHSSTKTKERPLLGSSTQEETAQVEKINLHDEEDLGSLENEDYDNVDNYFQEKEQEDPADSDHGFVADTSHSLDDSSVSENSYNKD